jgi:hypothetical protein
MAFGQGREKGNSSGQNEGIEVQGGSLASPKCRL